MLHCKIGDVVYLTYPTSGTRLRVGEVVDIRDTEEYPVKRKRVPRHSQYLITVHEWLAWGEYQYRSFYHGYAVQQSALSRFFSRIKRIFS